MPLGRALESASVIVLLNKLASQQVIDFFLKWKIDGSLLTKLKTFLLMVNALLNHAEERQVEDPHVKAWLDEVKDAAYDAEDILDEIATDALESRHSTNNKVRGSVYDYVDASDSVKEGIDFKLKDIASALNPFKERIESQMTNIVLRLEDIAKQKDILRLRSDGDEGRSVGEIKRLTTPMVDKSSVYGRDNDKEKIIDLLINSEGIGNEVVGVVPIVGMGGVGKTTLAQIVYNDVDKVKQLFNLRAWACVSDEFDVMRITKALVESAAKRTSKTKNLDLLQQDLMNVLKGKKFLIVLDDVWNENYGSWADLRVPFKVGAPGSRIIVTTRNNGVASVMRTVLTYHLKELSKDDCRSLFEQIAFPHNNSDAYPKLKMIGEEIVKKCKGLPLAAKALGGLLRSETDEKYWNDILHSKLWSLQNDSILPALRLSYHHLPTHLKQCFLFCSMFQKDYEFEEEKLVQLWMAEGFLQQPDGEERLEDVGSKYFSLLLSRSFFQQYSGDNSLYVMHDLIHDLAQFVSGKVCVRMEGKTELVKQKNVYEKARHLSYIRGDDDVFPKFEPFSKLKCLRTFLPLDPLHGFTLSYLTNMVLHDLLPKLRFLRVLSLSGYLITNIPDSIGDLKHLRYLNLSHNLMDQLPDSISGLFNLQTLILYQCRSLTKLPADMGSLTNLRHLNTLETSIKEMPLRMGKLIRLQSLSNFVVGKGSRPGIREFKDLLHLQGTLSISELQNVVNVKDAIEARLQVKPHLDELILEWSNVFDDLRNENAEIEILDALEPHENLKKLSVKYYGGTKFPSWMEATLLTNLVFLNLYGCIKCKQFPSLSQLPLLKDLIIEGMDGIKDVGVEFHGDGQPFPALETLKFENMKEWEKWSSFGEVVEFPHLRELSIYRCPKLTRFSHQFPSLEKLRIKNCEELTDFSRLSSSENLEFPRLSLLILVGCTKLKKLPNSLPSLQTLEIDGCEELAALPRLEKLLNFDLLGSNVEILNTMVDLSSLISLHLNQILFVRCLPERFVQQSTKLQELKIVGCGDLVGLSDEHVGLQQFAYLRRLTISHCPELIALPDEEEKLPPTLEFLDLRHCQNLKKLPYELYKLKSLRELRVESCPKFKSFPDKGLPWMLKILEIQNCGALETLPEGLFCEKTSLEHLEIRSCSSLVSFLQKGKVPSTLKHLKLYYCRRLQLLPEGLMCTDNMGLEYLEIDSCSSLETFPIGELPVTLKRLEISNCAKLQSLPVNLLNLKNLDRLEISDCSSLKEFPKDGLPTVLRSFKVSGCENLKSLPYRIQNLKSLRELEVSGCSSLITLPKQGLPTKINTLDINNCEKLNPVHEWKLHKLTSLEHFFIGGCPGLVSFSNEYLLPHSIICLYITELPDLISLSEGLQNLNSLEALSVKGCRKLQSLPKEGLPASVSRLTIRACPLLKPRCTPDKGEDWPKIANIPFVELTN